MDRLEFDVGFRDDGSLQSLIDHVQKAKEVLTDTDSADILEKSGIGSEQLTAINEMLTGSLTVLEGLSSEMAKVPQYMQTASFGLKTELESMYQLVNKIGTSYQKINSSEISKLDTARKMMALSASIKSNVGTMQEVRNLNTAAKNVKNFSRETFGFQNYETFQQIAPEVAMQRLNPLVQKMMNANRRGFTNIDGVVNQIMGDSSFTSFYRGLGKSVGADYLTDAQIRNGVLAILGQHSMYGQQLSTSKTLKDLQAQGVLKVPDKTDRFIQDRLSNEHQIRSFNTYAQDKKTDDAAIAFLSSRSNNGDPIREIDKKHRKSSGLQDFYNYLKQGTNMGDLFPLLKEAGIATAPIGSGSYHLNSKIHESQLQYLAARAVQKYRDSLASEAPYEIDPTDYFNTEKTLGRQGKKPQLYGGLLRALPNDVIPSLSTYDPSKPFTDVGRSYNTHIQFDKTPSFDRYYIPSTKFDPQTGGLVERNVNWRKDLSKGIEKRKSDEYVAITDSLISRMFGMEGNGTLGYGRDKNTGAIIRYIQDPKNPDKTIAAPSSLISVDFSQFLKEDEANPGRVKPDTSHPMYQQAIDYLAGKRLLKYGGNEYHYLYQDDEGGAVFGLNDIYEREVQRYEKLGLRHPFQAGNEGDMLFGGNRQKFSKQTNTLKKLSSSAVPLEDLYDGLETLKTEAPLFVNFSMLYDMIDEMNGTDDWGKDSGRRMNGQVWGDPKLFKKSMQMRFGMGTDKFMISGVDWRPMLKQGWSAGNALNQNIFGRDENGNIAVYVPGGHMSTDEDYAAVKSFITGNKYQVVDGKVQLITDNTGAPVPLTADESLKIRNERMVNILGKGPALMDRESMKSESGYRNLSIEKFRKQFGQPALDEAIAQGRQEGNTIRLTSAQSAMDMLRYSRSWDHGWDEENGGVGKYSGYFAMKNDRDMESSKEYLPESLLRAINAPASVFENSERRYRERLAELDTMSGRIKQFEGDENAMAEIRRNPNWVFESQTAIQHIANTRNTLLKNRALNKVIMDENREGTVGTDTVGEIAELFMGLVPGLKPTAFGKFQALLPSVMDKANAVYAPGLSEEDISMMMRFPIATRQLALNVKNYAQSKEGKKYLKNIKTVQSLDTEISDAQGGIKTQDKLIEHYNSLLADPNISKENADKVTQQIAKANQIKERLSKQNELRESLRDTLNDEILTQEETADKNPDSPIAFIRARRLTGQDPLDVATTMSASMMYQFNTGDFDGDTIYAFYKMSEEAMRNAEEENKAFDAYKKGQKNAQKAAEQQKKIAQQSEPVTSVGAGRLEVMAQSINSKQAMASASAALRKAQTANPNDPYRVAGLVESMEAYDKATSDVKTKGLEATMGEYAKMYLTSQGQHYERFVKALYENENEDEPYGKKIFGVSFASKFDPEGLMALAIRRDNSLGLGQTDVRSLDLMEKWYQDNYGGDMSKEAEAARFMLDRLEDSQIFGKIWTDKDSQRGWKKHDAWLKEIEGKASRGQNVEEDMAKLTQFRKRLEEQDSGDFVNERTVKEELAKYQQLYAQTGDETFKKYTGYLQRYLPLDKNAETKREEDIQQEVTDASIAQMRKERAARAAEIREMMDNANEEADLANRLQYRRTRAVKDAFNPELMGETGRISPYNWSSVKHYIGYKNNENAVVAMPDSSALEILRLRGAVGADGKINANAFEESLAGKTITYNAHQTIQEIQADMIKMLSGEERDTSAYKNEWTHIGQLMHSAFEEYFDPSKKSINPLKEIPNTPEERIEATRQAFRDMILGKRDNGERMDRAALTDLGFKVKEDETTGNLIVSSSHLNTKQTKDMQTRINNLIGYTEGGQRVEGTIESFLKVMNAYMGEGDKTFSIEDKLFDTEGNLQDARYGGNIWKEVVTDKDGNIIRTDHSLDKGGFAPVAEGETSHTFLTHAKPDLVRQDKDGNLLLYDYKSGGEGAFESLLQSAFYSDMLFDLGRKAWQNPDDSRYEPYKPWAKEITNKETGEKEYVSAVKKVVGINPRGEGEAIGIDITTAEGKKWAAEQLLRVNDAFLSLEKAGRAENPLAEGMAQLINAAQTYNTVQKEVEAAQATAEKMFANGQNKNVADYFLSTFASQREQFADLEKEVNKDYYKYHQNLDMAGMNRFSLREAEISKLFDEKVTAAYLAGNGDDEAIETEIRNIKTDKIKALQRNSEAARLAATQDITDAETSIRQMFKGVEPTTEADVVIGAFQKLARAKQQKDYLRENTEYYDPFYKNEKGEVVGRFLTEGNDARAQEAIARKQAYEDAVRLGNEADEFLLSEAGAYVNRYTRKDSKRIQNMIKAEPLDATEKFNEFVQQQVEELQKEIDTYNETVNKLTDQRKKTADPKKQMLLDQLIEHANEQQEAIKDYLQKGGPLDKTIADEKKKLGIMSKTPAQRADEWYNERVRLVNGSLERDELHARREALNAAVSSGDQAKIEESAKAYAFAQQRYDDWVKNYGGDATTQETMLKAQADALKNVWQYQENQPYNDFINKIFKLQETPEARAQHQLNDLYSYVAQQSTNTSLSNDARQNWTNLLLNGGFWRNQFGEYVEQNKNQETFEHFQQTNRLENVRDQNNLRIQQLERQYDNANRQQAMRYNTSRVIGAVYSLNQRKESARAQYENYNQQIQAEQRNKQELAMRMSMSPVGSKDYKEAAKAYAVSEEKLNGLSSAANVAKQQLNDLNKITTAGQAIFGAFGQNLNMVLTRFGRQLFMKALNETKNFVKQFDKSMTSIQMITLKSDEQMSKLGTGLISKAKELKVSVSDISQSAETLYRQGLTDEEVDTRLETISKFSKVSGTKVDAATKLITVAMNTGLVTNPQQAADIVTALGDNAATNASEIEKGIEKAGAAAAADGTSFAELAAMLTAITSTTQIGGNVAGRTLNTIFGRMNKIGTNEIIYDENGYAVSGSAVSKLLKAQGIETYENGKKRSTYDVLYDLSQKWDSLNDATQQQLATQIAGTRQYSNFAAIMQGMAEGKVDEYMNLVADSEGIVDEKYNVYLGSLEASLTDVKNTWDSLINSLTDSGSLGGFFDSISNIISGVESLSGSLGGLGSVLVTVIPLLIALTGIKSGNILGMIAGIGLAVGTASVLNNIGTQSKTNQNYVNGVSRSAYVDQTIETRSSETKRVDDLISETRTLMNKPFKSNEEEIQLKQNLTDLSVQFSGLGISLDDLTTAGSNAAKALQEIEDANEEQKKKDTLEEIKQTKEELNVEAGSKYLNANNNVDDLVYNLIAEDYNTAERLIWDPKVVTQYPEVKEANSSGLNYWQLLSSDNLTLAKYAISGLASQVPSAGFGQLETAMTPGTAKKFFGFTGDTTNARSLIEYFIQHGYYNNGTSDKSSMLQAILSNPSAIKDGFTLDDILLGNTYGAFDEDLYNLFIKTTSGLVNDAIYGRLGVVSTSSGAEKKEGRTSDVKYYGARLKQIASKASGAQSEEAIDYIVSEFESKVLSDGFENLSNIDFFNSLQGAYSEYLNKLIDVDGSARQIDLPEAEQNEDELVEGTWSFMGKKGYTYAAAKKKQDEALEEMHGQEGSTKRAWLEPSSPVAEPVYDFDNKENLTQQEFDEARTSIAMGKYFANGIPDVYHDVETGEYAYSEDELRGLYRPKAISRILEKYPSLKLGNEENEIIDSYIDEIINEKTENGALVNGMLADNGDVVPFEAMARYAQKRAEEEGWENVVGPTETFYNYEGKERLNENELEGAEYEFEKKIDTIKRGPIRYYESKTGNAITNAKSAAGASQAKKMSADSFIEDIYSEGITDLQGLLEAVEQGKLPDFANVVSDLGLYSLLEDAYLFDEDTGAITSVDENNAIFSKLMAIAAANSLSHTGLTEGTFMETRKHGENVAKYLAAYKSEGGIDYIPSDDELKTVLGTELAARLKQARDTGDYSKISDEELRYARRKAAAYSLGMPDLTAREKLAGIKEVRRNIETLGTEGGYNREIADQYMSQWSGWTEYAGLMTKKNTEGLTQKEQEDLDALNASLNNFQKNAEIKLEIQGLQELESAGELLEGTAANIEKIKKGGRFEIEAVINIRSSTYKDSQIDSMLRYGTDEQKREAVKQVEGITDQQYFEEKEKWTNKALEDRATARENTAISRAKERAALSPDKVAQFDADMLAAGYEWVEGSNFELPRGYEFYNNGHETLVVKKGTTDADYELTEAYQNAGPGYYKDVGAPSLDDVNPLLLQAQNYTEAEKNRMLDSIIAGTTERTTGENGNSALYDAAVESAGEYTKELLRRQKSGETIDDWLQIASDNERSAYQLQMLTGMSSNITKAQQAQWAMSNLSRPESTGYLASYLNMNEEDVKKLIKTEDGKKELESKLEETSKALFSSLSESLGLDLDFSDMSSLKEQLQTAADNAEGMLQQFLLWMVGTVDEAGNILGTTGYQTFDETYAKQQEQTVKTKEALAEAKTIIDSGDYSNLGSNNNVSWENLPTQLLYMMKDREMYGEGSNFTDEMINQAYENALYGRSSSPESQAAIMNSLFAGDMSAQSMIERYQEWMSNLDTYAPEIETFNSLEGHEKIAEAMTSEQNAVEKTTQAVNDYNKEVGPKQIEYLNKYGDATSSVANTVKAFGKNAKSAASALGGYTTNLNKIARANTLIKGVKGKSGKQLNSEEMSLFEEYGYNKNDIKAKTAEELEGIRKSIEDAINESWSEEVAAPIVELMNSLMADGTMPEEVAVHLSTLVKADGTFDVSAAIAYLESQGNAAYNSLISTLKAFDGMGGSLTVDLTGNGFVLRATETGDSNERRGGGGGGGGKSAVDKLIEEQKRRLAELEHESKMLSIEEKGYDYSNDYSGWHDNIQDQINLQEQLREAYKQNIQELENMLAKTRKGSDDWYKLKDAIYAAEEALAEVNNTINDLNLKDISILSDEMEDADKFGNHVINMLDKRAQQALSEDRFQDYERLTERKIQETKDQRSQNNLEILRWKDYAQDQLNKGEIAVGDDAWNEILNKIWELDEENAELDKSVTEMELELNEQRLSQIAKVTQENLQTATHNNNLASMYGNVYESLGYRKNYETMITEQMSNNEKLIAENTKAKEAVKEEMATLVEGSTAWFDAQAALYQYDEALAQTNISQMELNHALEESKMQGIAEAYEDWTRDLTHVNDLLSEEIDLFKETGDTKAQKKALQMYISNEDDIISAKKQSLEDLNKQLAEGLAAGTLDPAMQRALLDEINATETDILKMENDKLRKQREMDKIDLDKMLTDQNWEASEYSHNTQLLGYKSSKYQNAGELTNYGTMLKADISLREKRTDTLKDEIAALKEQAQYYRDKYGPGTAEEKEITEQIMKREEELEKENTEIEKDNKLLEENADKIRKVRKSLEDLVDKEIEAQKKREREILSANVSMQDTILNLLRQRLQKEWELKKKDIEKEKEALSEYKKLINERFNYRKKASEQADKEEELANYRRQLALIEADPTRSKDAKELRRKISDIEKEQAWNLAEEEVNAENERIDEQMTGMDKFVQYNEELLNEILSDANNFAAEINDLLSGSFEESYAKILDFMGKENEAFMKSLPDSQKQMIQGWEDTWKKAKDIVDNNYAYITEIIQDSDSYINYMKSTNREYIALQEELDKAIASGNASEAESLRSRMAIMVKGWQDYYDNYIASIKDDATFTPDEHDLGEVKSKEGELDDELFDVDTKEITGEPAYTPEFDNSAVTAQDFSGYMDLVLESLDGIYKAIAPEDTPTEETPTDSGAGGNTPGGSKGKYTAYAVAAYYDSNGLQSVQGKGTGDTQEEANKAAAEDAKSKIPTGHSLYTAGSGVYTPSDNGSVTLGDVTGLASVSTADKEKAFGIENRGEGLQPTTSSHGYTISFNGKTYNKSGFDTKSEAERAASAELSRLRNTVQKPAGMPSDAFAALKKSGSYSAYEKGGLVDYTGPAWVDGTKTQPEAFLSAIDTENMRAMLDAFNFIKDRPYMSYIDPDIYGNTTNIGDINITINQAELKSDADYDMVARKVGQAFSKQLSRQGLNLNGYAF